MKTILDRIRGDGLSARALRGSSWAFLGFGGSQFLRLASNLVLTRLLFPEAFGVMALVQVLMMGLAMFSDLGVSPAILQSKRGDDPSFLNTAWTIQVIRGFVLWGAAALLAWPLALFFNEPQLALFIPVAAVSLAVAGFNPTRLDTANRHLLLGRVTVVELASQTVGIVAAIFLAWLLQSAWALVFSGIISAVAFLGLASTTLPGAMNRFRWEKKAASELIHFGKWIFLSTVAGFFYGQGDRVILGRFLSLSVLGVYNIGYFLANVPLFLGSAMVRKVMIPLYRERPPLGSVENFRKIQKLRFILTGGLIALTLLFAVFGVWLTDLLYDDRYTDAGAVLVLISIAQIPAVIALPYDQAALAAGDSKRFFILSASRAVLMMLGLYIGMISAGLLGALIGQAIAGILIYPVAAWLARLQGAWDPYHDGIFAVLGVFAAVLALWWNFAAISAL